MPCFGHRARSPSPPAPSLSTRHFARSRTYTSTRSSDAARPPLEDLGATKRRLVCIRRQSDAAPVTLAVGFKSRTGWQPLSTSRENQDSLALVLPLPEPLHHHSLFAVFDGHGRGGHRVSAYVAEHVAAAFHAVLQADKTAPPELALRRACMRSGRALMAQARMDVSMTGTTAALAAVHGRTLVCANVGDSRIVLGTRKNGRVVPIALTTDHVPEIPAERRRIEAAGGRVERWTPAGLDTGPARVWLKERRIPGLAMSRVIGDSILEGIVSAEPEMTSHHLVEDDCFMVVATDGVWGQMSNDDVVQFVNERGGEGCQPVAEALVKRAAELWFAGDGETIDDISAILVRFNW